MSRALRICQWGVLLLVALMPFHAFLSVWAGHLLGHQVIWQSWKEAVLIILVGCSAYLVARKPDVRRRLHNPVVYAIGAFALIALIVTVLAMPTSKAILFGFKTDFEFLAAFVVGLLAGNRNLAQRLTKVVLISSGFVIGFGLLQIFFLPRDWLAQFGYGVSTILPYLKVDPVLDDVRVLSTLGGPNQLGSFLILPICLALALMIRGFKWWQPIVIAGGLLVEWHTYSRSGWLGLAVAMAITVLFLLPRNWRLPSLLGITVVAAIALNLLISHASGSSKLQYYVFHSGLNNTGISASTEQHGHATAAGVQAVKDHPWGQGLGTAGPASFYSPRPFIPESWYLQIAVETGILGLIAFVGIELALFWRLAHRSLHSAAIPAVMGALMGVSVVNFFLHGWADSSTALILWIYAGVVLAANRERKA
jgi:O-antigen ligase